MRKWIWKCFWLIFFAGTYGCASGKPERAAVEPERLEAQVERCVAGAEPARGWEMKIRSVSVEEAATRVEIGIRAMEEAVQVDLPVYRLSRGRWLIGAAGRTYLVDATCREYKLKDRKAGPGREIPLEGRVRLRRGEEFEAVLLFPRLPDEARVGMLVYDGRKLPFAIGVAGR